LIPTHPWHREEFRIKNIPGGFINEACRVMGVLATCRALGDFRLNPYVSCRPDMNKIMTANGRLMILAWYAVLLPADG
jgi:hypothetical protein